MSLTSEKTKYEHVALDDKGVPIIVGTNMKVIEIAWKKLPTGGALKSCIFSTLILRLARYTLH